eukprot:477569-Amphidinium_carterae.2
MLIVAKTLVESRIWTGLKVEQTLWDLLLAAQFWSCSTNMYQHDHHMETCVRSLQIDVGHSGEMAADTGLLSLVHTSSTSDADSMNSSGLVLDWSSVATNRYVLSHSF